MKFLKAILNMNKLRIYTLLVVRVLNKENKGDAPAGVKGRDLLEYLVNMLLIDRDVAQNTILNMVKQNLLVVENTNMIKLNNETTKYFQLLVLDVDELLLDRIVKKSVSFRTIRLYLLMRMFAYPKVKTGLKYSYSKMTQDYNKTYNVDVSEYDIYMMIEELIENGLITKETYNNHLDDYKFNEYKFIDKETILKNLF